MGTALRCVELSFDGDADRIVFFYTKNGALMLIDGDKIAALVATYLQAAAIRALWCARGSASRRNWICRSALCKLPMQTEHPQSPSQS